MKCITCGAETYESTTTDITDINNCLLIIRNVPCNECTECNEILYTGNVVKQLEKMRKSAQQTMNDISIIDYIKKSA